MFSQVSDQWVTCHLYLNLLKRHQLTSWVAIWTKCGLYHRVNQLIGHSKAQKQHFWRYSLIFYWTWMIRKSFSLSCVTPAQHSTQLTTISYLKTLGSGFGVGGTALKWFTSYLSQRFQQIQIKGTLSEKKQLTTGVPHGSCLGPVLFTIYVADIFQIIEKHLPEAQGYADDHQVYLPFRPIPATNQTASVTAIENCVAELRSCLCWMTARQNSWL